MPEAGEDSTFHERLQEFMEGAQRPESPLSPSELRALRRMLDEYEKAAWLKKKILVYFPHTVAFVAAGWGLWTWLGAYFGSPK